MVAAAANPPDFNFSLAGEYPTLFCAPSRNRRAKC
jgi:hypothetical protein